MTPAADKKGGRKVVIGSRPSRIAVTGGAGFIGLNLIRLIRQESRNAQVVVIDNESAGLPAELPADITYRRGDIRELDLKSLFTGCDVVIHLAAQTSVMKSVADPISSFDVNAYGTLRVLTGARDAGVNSVILASSAGAIWGESRAPRAERMVPEPTSPYGASKVAMEVYGSCFAKCYGLKVCSLRFSNVYGPFSRLKGSIVATLFRQVLDGHPITIFGDGNQIRDFVFVDDISSGILQAIDADATGAFQLGSGKSISVNDLLKAVTEVVGQSRMPAVRHEPARRGEVLEAYCDLELSREMLGFSPRVPLAVGLSRTWDWFAQNG